MDLIKIDINTNNLVDSAQNRDYWEALVIVDRNVNLVSTGTNVTPC